MHTATRSIKSQSTFEPAPITNEEEALADDLLAAIAVWLYVESANNRDDAAACAANVAERVRSALTCARYGDVIAALARLDSCVSKSTRVLLLARTIREIVVAVVTPSREERGNLLDRASSHVRILMSTRSTPVVVA